jgi:hypothetical protein
LRETNRVFFVVALTFALGLAVLPTEEASAEAANTALTGVEILDAPDSTAVKLILTGPLPEASSEVRGSELVISLPLVGDATGGTRLEVGGQRIERVRVVQASPITLHVVIEAAALEDPFRGRGIAPVEDGLLVTVGSGPVVASAEETPAGAATEAEAMASAPAPVAAAAEPASDSGPQPLRADGLRFTVTDFELLYAREHPDLPPLADLRRVEVELGVTAQGYVAPRANVPSERLRLIDVRNAPRQQFYGSAIRTINEALVHELNRRGLAGVLVLPHEEDIDPRASRDLRPPDRQSLRLVIWTGRLLEFRTFASGERVPEEERVDNPVHRRIKEASPIQPGDLLRKRELDEYVARLNRHPGRSVDTALSAAQEPGGVYLDYLVAESRPLRAYVQASNTGTDTTTEWRQRFGVVHTQLTNRDDLFRLDYISGNFDEVNAVFGSYEMPVWKWDWLRANVGGSWSQYDASDLAFPGSSFDGEQWDIGSQAIYTLFQKEKFFLDVFGGLRFRRVEVVNRLTPPPSPGDASFFLPEVGLRAEREDEFSNFRAAVYSVFNVAAVADTSRSDINSLGRTAVNDRNFEIFYWDLFGSFFLEPLLNRAGYDDPSTPLSSALAHEIQLRTRGQHSLGNRLTPQFEGVLGGLRTVRGHNQSISAGDTSVLARAEYRFHLPRVLPIRPVPEEVPVIGGFRWARQQVYGLPDWDLILRAFFDYGRTITEGNVPGEFNDTLMAAGPGVELRILDHLILSFDYGVALKDVKRVGAPPVATAGSHEFHFSGSLIY